MATVNVEFRILGPLEVIVDGAPIKLGGAKQQLVLASLLIEPNRVVSVDRLIEWVWNDDVPERNATLQVYVSNLRRLLSPIGEALGREIVTTRRPGYSIEIGDGELDAIEFERLRLAGEQALRSGAPHEAAPALRAALALWRGDPLAGLPLEGVAQHEVTRLEVARSTVIEQLGEAEVTLGHHQDVVNDLSAWVLDASLNERLRGLLMLALYRCGRQADALATYKEGRERLVEELGIDPSKELRDLENRILAQDPSLDWVPEPTLTRMPPVDATILRSSVLAQDAYVTIDGATVVLDKAVTTIGRLPDRDLVVLDAGASRVHAEIHLTPDGFRLVDAGSGNGTVIDGERVRERLLDDGDVIRIGSTEITFRTGKPSSE